MPPTPPALTAVERSPALRAYLPALHAQQRRIVERLSHAVPRAELIAEFDTLLSEVQGGVLTVEGVAGSGATTLLCQLAAEQSYPFWFAAETGDDGFAALCAQIIALHDLAIPLVPPAIEHDAQAFERLLVDALAQRAPHDPLVILIDMPCNDITELLLPRGAPAGVVLVYTCEPKANLHIEPEARLRLPSSGPLLLRGLAEAGVACGLSETTATHVAAHSRHSWLYKTLACGLLGTGVLQPHSLPDGLDALHVAWWQTLTAPMQQLACVLAAAGEALPLELAARAADFDLAMLEPLFARWATLIEYDAERVSLYHPATRQFINAQSPGRVQAAHTTFVQIGREQFGSGFDQQPDQASYMARQLARHVRFCDSTTQQHIAPLLARRTWALAQERRTGSLRQAARDAAWMARIAAEQGDLSLVVHHAIIAGTLATWGRQVAPDTAAQALTIALERGEPREIVFRRVRAIIDQLPDGHAKAQVLRRLGEVCFERNIRSQAMRMLAEAIDMEVPGLPRSWRNEREEAQVVLARAAISARAPDRALGITVRIAHAERRGLSETEVVRHLIEQGQLTRAEEVALAITHAQTHEWAMAEVAAGHARVGNTQRFREVVGTLKTETAIAWARAELACDAARRGDTSAVEQVALISSLRGRDQALGLVAQALVTGNQPASAIMAARMIDDRDVRAHTLIDLALLKVPNAVGALGMAADDIRTLGDDERLPLVVMLATAYAAIGDLAAALRTVEQLEAGEERDRGRSRVATALARAGEFDTAARIARAIPDDDERDWTLHELANSYAAIGRFERAATLVALIVDGEQRASAEADQCIARAKAGRVAGALAGIDQVALPAERARALAAIVGPMVDHGFQARAEAARRTIESLAARSRYVVVLSGALAATGQLDSAQRLALQADRPLDQARALAICARASTNKLRATSMLTEALLIAATIGRTEMITLLVSSADVLVRLGGSELLLAAAHALDEVDSWWG